MLKERSKNIGMIYSKALSKLHRKGEFNNRVQLIMRSEFDLLYCVVDGTRLLELFCMED